VTAAPAAGRGFQHISVSVGEALDQIELAREGVVSEAADEAERGDLAEEQRA
jgi:hypothetical protein